MTEQDDSRPPIVEFHQIKGNAYRVIHVDGGIGGITPRGFVHIALYNERHPIPKVRVMEPDGEGGFGAERTTEILGEPNIGVTREVEVSLLCDYATARELRDWFTRQVEEMERAQQAQAGVDEDSDK